MELFVGAMYVVSIVILFLSLGSFLYIRKHLTSELYQSVTKYKSLSVLYALLMVFFLFAYVTCLVFWLGRPNTEPIVLFIVCLLFLGSVFVGLSVVVISNSLHVVMGVRLSELDSMTGLMSKNNFELSVQKILNEGYGKYTLVVIDMDQFKEINDTYGHTMGDQVIKYTADVLRDAVRSNDLVGRFGGDEFLVLFYGMQAEQLPQTMSRIERAVVNLQREHGCAHLSKISYGAVEIEGGSKVDYQEVFERADKLLYQMKTDKRSDLEASAYQDWERLSAKDRVLVVDDDELTRTLLRDELAANYEVVEATNGQEALSIIEEDKAGFSAILTDLIMPVMGGVDLLKQLQQSDYSHRIPVVVITSDRQVEVETECLALGAMDFIRKPFNFPIINRRVRNVVELFRYQHHLEDEVARKTLELYAKNCQLEEKSQDLQALANDLERTNARIIEVLGNVVEFRNVESGEHISRVMLFTEVLANNMRKIDPECGLTEHDVEVITQASPMHDVGKIGIPDSILLKPGKLSDDEFELMKTHPTLGLDLLKSFKDVWSGEYLRVCGEICHYHHERYDGRGYPEGLKGEEIPISAQLVALADVYDALVSDRVYRAGIESAEACKMIKNGECGAFSERMLSCFDASIPELEVIDTLNKQDADQRKDHLETN